MADETNKTDKTYTVKEFEEVAKSKKLTPEEISITFESLKKQGRIIGEGVPTIDKLPETDKVTKTEKEIPPEEKTSGIKAFLTGLGEGATLGLGKHLLASTMAGGGRLPEEGGQPFDEELYKKSLERIKAYEAKAKKDQPVATTIGDVASYLTPGTAPAAIAKGTVKLAAKTGLKKWAANAALKKPVVTALKKAAVGVPEGIATTAITEGTKVATTDKEAKDLPTDIVIGGVAGGALPLLATGAKALGRKMIGTAAGIKPKEIKEVTAELIDNIDGPTVTEKYKNVEKELAENRTKIETALKDPTAPKINLNDVLNDVETRLVGTEAAPVRSVDRKAVANTIKQLRSNLVPAKASPEVDLVEADKIRAHLVKLANFEKSVENNAKQDVANDMYEVLRNRIDLAIDNATGISPEGKQAAKFLNKRSSELAAAKEVLERQINPEAFSPEIQAVDVTRPVTMLKAAGTIPGEVVAKAGKVLEQINPLTRISKIESKITKALPYAEKYTADLAERSKVEGFDKAAFLKENPMYEKALKIEESADNLMSGKAPTVAEEDLASFSFNALKQSGLEAATRMKAGTKAPEGTSDYLVAKNISGKGLGEVEAIPPREPLAGPKPNKPKGPDDLPEEPSGGIKEPIPPVAPKEPPRSLKDITDEMDMLKEQDPSDPWIQQRTQDLKAERQERIIEDMKNRGKEILTKNTGAEALKSSGVPGVAPEDIIPVVKKEAPSLEEQIRQDALESKAARAKLPKEEMLTVKDEAGNVLKVSPKSYIAPPTKDFGVPEVTVESVGKKIAAKSKLEDEIQQAQDELAKASAAKARLDQLAEKGVTPKELKQLHEVDKIMKEKVSFIEQLKRKLKDEGGFLQIPGGAPKLPTLDEFLAKANLKHPGAEPLEKPLMQQGKAGKYYYYYNNPETKSTHVVVWDPATGEMK